MYITLEVYLTTYLIPRLFRLGYLVKLVVLSNLGLTNMFMHVDANGLEI